MINFVLFVVFIILLGAVAWQSNENKALNDYIEKVLTDEWLAQRINTRKFHLICELSSSCNKPSIVEQMTVNDFIKILTDKEKYFQDKENEELVRRIDELERKVNKKKNNELKEMRKSGTIKN